MRIKDSKIGQKPTDELNKLLENMKPGELDEYLEENQEYIAGTDRSFYEYMKTTIRSKGIKLKDVYQFAGFSESFGSQLLYRDKHTTDRDMIIRLCLAGHFTWDEMNRALKIYGFSELYAKDPRDACLIVQINNRVYDIYQINDELAKRGLELLSAGTEA